MTEPGWDEARLCDNAATLSGKSMRSADIAQAYSRQALTVQRIFADHRHVRPGVTRSLSATIRGGRFSSPIGKEMEKTAHKVIQ